MVLCAFENNDAGILSTGSEDCSARLWDLRINRSVRRFGFDNEVTCVKSGPTPHEWYISSGNSLFVFDIRNENRLLLHQDMAVSCLQTTLDEINDFDTFERDVVSVNDLGEVHSWSPTFSGFRTRHRNSLGTCVRFLSRSLAISGGLDNRLVVSNLKTGKEVIHFEMTSHNPLGCNPPHVHALDILPSTKEEENDDKDILVAVGDGSLSLLRLRNKRDFLHMWKTQIRVQHVHRAACVSAQFLNQHTAVSVGQDSHLAVTDLLALNVQHVVALEEKPNAVCASRIHVGQVFVCDTSETVKIVPIL